MARSSQRPRNLLVWLHITTSVGWMSQALALFTLLVFGLAAGDPSSRLAAFSMAAVLDEKVLICMANGSAFTGFMLAALTPWGYFRHWWVLAKFAITISQLYVGIFLLSQNLPVAVHAARGGEDGRAASLAAGTALMAAAIGFQAWLSVSKPWKRTPWANNSRATRKLPTGPKLMFQISVAAPFLDYLLGVLLFGFPLPGMQALLAIGYPIRRGRLLRRQNANSTRAFAADRAARRPSRAG